MAKQASNGGPAKSESRTPEKAKAAYWSGEVTRRSNALDLEAGSSPSTIQERSRGP